MDVMVLPFASTCGWVVLAAAVVASESSGGCLDWFIMKAWCRFCPSSSLELGRDDVNDEEEPVQPLLQS